MVAGSCMTKSTISREIRESHLSIRQPQCCSLGCHLLTKLRPQTGPADSKAASRCDQQLRQILLNNRRPAACCPRTVLELSFSSSSVAAGLFAEPTAQQTPASAILTRAQARRAGLNAAAQRTTPICCDHAFAVTAAPPQCSHENASPAAPTPLVAGLATPRKRQTSTFPRNSTAGGKQWTYYFRRRWPPFFSTPHFTKRLYIEAEACFATGQHL